MLLQNRFLMVDDLHLQKEVYRVDGNHHLELSVNDQQQKEEASHENDAQVSTVTLIHLQCI